jgi:hypothetical protein
MHTTIRSIAGWICTAALWTAHPAAGEERLPLRVKLVATRHVRERSHEIERARAEASRIFDASGVDLVWLDGQNGTDDQGVIVVLSGTAIDRFNRTAALGAAMHSGSGRAYVFCDRVDLFARRHQVDAGRVLGHVLAHELGHLLLEDMPHSPNGLMRADWYTSEADQMRVGALRFGSAEGRAIREVLRRPPARYCLQPPNCVTSMAPSVATGSQTKPLTHSPVSS